MLNSLMPAEIQNIIPCQIELTIVENSTIFKIIDKIKQDEYNNGGKSCTFSLSSEFCGIQIIIIKSITRPAIIKK